MKFLSKAVQIQIVPSECLVGIGREIPFEVLTTRKPNVKWTCSKDGIGCSENFLNATVPMATIMFPSEGSYELQAEVTVGENTKSSTSKVAVDPKVIPHVQVKYFPPQPVSITESTEIVVTILNLIPNCVAYWNVVLDDGFANFSDGAEGNFTDMGKIYIKDFEEYFLQELVDYDNNTSSKDITLRIPSDSLNPRVKYKFRLTVTCPETLTDSSTQATRANVTSFYDIILVTNEPPKTFPLIVKPLKGIPMNQTFKFTTGAAKDSPTDFPLKYTFGYVVNNFTVIIATFYENTVANTKLPFADKIETFFEACDNNEACARISGPTIATNVKIDYSPAEKNFVVDEFHATLRRSEYGKSLNTAVVLLLTLREIESDTSGYEAKMFSMMKAELNHLKFSGGADFIYQQKIVDFVKMAKDFMNFMTISDEAFVENLLSLSDTISRSSRKAKRATFSNKGSSNIVTYGINHIKTVLELSEMLLVSNNASVVQKEKKQFVEKIHKFITLLCQDQNLNTQFIETKFAKIKVTKVFSPQLTLEPQPMMTDDEFSILFTSNGVFSSKYICLGQAKLLMDMFTASSESSEPVYETMILDNDGAGSMKPIPITDFSDSVTVEISGNLTDETKTCVMWKETAWSSEACVKKKTNSTSRLLCKCKMNGIKAVVLK